MANFFDFQAVYRSAIIHHGGRRCEYEAAVRATSSPSVCPAHNQTPPAYARPVAIDQPDVLALRFMIRQLSKLKLEPAPARALDCSSLSFSRAHALGRPLQLPSAPLAHASPVLVVRAHYWHLRPTFAEIANSSIFCSCVEIGAVTKIGRTLATTSRRRAHKTYRTAYSI